ncbi:hypothetical protein [uncultured Rikenella sp.]|uniref:hypothetical protein n=1 Tax=uncultured Rikenella sp. TaxID=368003 RepID=UPI0025D8D180|nr:hypothetical protein [uncultured Rikenella sp.]
MAILREAADSPDWLSIAAPGYRSAQSGAPTESCRNGYSYSSSFHRDQGRFLFFGTRELDPSNPNYRAYGFQLRCLSE